MTSKIRQFSIFVLASWLISWGIVVLQPCCDSILQSSQSHHSPSDNIHHTDHSGDGDHHVATESNHHESTHDCRIAIENLDDLAVPVTEIIKASSEQQLDNVYVIPLASSSTLSANTFASHIYHYTHSPPGNNQLYLSTHRIRI